MPKFDVSTKEELDMKTDLRSPDKAMSFKQPQIEVVDDDTPEAEGERPFTELLKSVFNQNFHISSKSRVNKIKKITINK